MSSGQHAIATSKLSCPPVREERNAVLCRRHSLALRFPFIMKISLRFLLSTTLAEAAGGPSGNILLPHAASHSRSTKRTTSSQTSLAVSSSSAKGPTWRCPGGSRRTPTKGLLLYKSLGSRGELRSKLFILQMHPRGGKGSPTITPQSHDHPHVHSTYGAGGFYEHFICSNASRHRVVFSPRKLRHGVQAYTAREGRAGIETQVKFSICSLSCCASRSVATPGA